MHDCTADDLVCANMRMCPRSTDAGELYVLCMLPMLCSLMDCAAHTLYADSWQVISRRTVGTGGSWKDARMPLPVNMAMGMFGGLPK